MSLTDKLNQLFEEWENSLDDYKEKFAKDGIINETEWLKTNCPAKIVEFCSI